MKYLKLSVLIATISFFGFAQEDYRTLIAKGTYTVAYISEIAEAHFDTVGRGRGTGYKPFKRWQYFAERLMDETGKLKSPEFYYNELINYNVKTLSEGFASRTTVGVWEDMGPTDWNATLGWNPGVGRITAIAVEQTNQDHIIVGGQTGGVWKTTDGGLNWTVLTDNLSNIDVYALAMDPTNNNTYYWGSTGGTIFKSIDGGSTWSLHATLPGGFINKILIDPTNTSKMYASSEGLGLYKSTDGGMSWNSIFFTGAPTGSAYDYEFKPGDPNTIYASGNAFYVSTNGGGFFSTTGGTGANQFSSGPKMIGVSQDDPNVVYVLEANGGAFGALYKSTDSGSSFIKLDHTGKNYLGRSSDPEDPEDLGVGQAPRDMDIAINPNDVNDVHIGGINTWRSTDGGVSFNITSQWIPGIAAFENIGYCHADIDFMKFIGTGTNAKLVVGTDGGIFIAPNPNTVNASYYTDLSSGLGIRQFYKIGISQTDPVVVTGGSQDNGTSFFGTDGVWRDWLGGDGMEGFVDKNNPLVMYGTAQFGVLFKTVNGGFDITTITQPDSDGNWVTPFEQDPITPNAIYAGFRQLYQSLDGGNTWSTISNSFGQNIDHFKIAPTDNSKIYLAINGQLRYTNNAGLTWNTSALNLSGGFINDIAVHPTDANKVAIATTDNGRVYVSSDGGITWSSIAWDLPNFSAQAVTWQNNGEDGLYVGMNYGIYYTDNALGNTWIPFNNGLPNVRINELEINYVDGKIYAGTYGRGLWRSNIYNSSSLSVNELDTIKVSVFPNPASNTFTLKCNLRENVSVRLYDSQGKIVFFSKDLNMSQEKPIDISSFNSGIYFVKINSVKGEVTKKLLIE